MIDSADQVEFSDLTDADAIPDGFASLAALKQEIENIYGSTPIGNLYRIRFHLLNPTDITDIEREKTDNCVFSTSSRLSVKNKKKASKRQKENPFIHEMKDGLLGNLHVQKSKKSSKVLEKTKEVLMDEKEPKITEKAQQVMLTETEVAKKLIQRCKINRNVCDWNHEPGKSQDFFALFLLSPRDDRGIPTLDGYRLRSLIREQVTPEEWDPICWIAEEVCRAWTEWQYAVEHWMLIEK